MKSFANINLNAAWNDLLLVVVVLDRWDLLGNRVIRTSRPVGDDGVEIKTKMSHQLQAYLWLSRRLS
jgi:hypothetical protein